MDREDHQRRIIDFCEREGNDLNQDDSAPLLTNCKRNSNYLSTDNLNGVKRQCSNGHFNLASQLTKSLEEDNFADLNEKGHSINQGRLLHPKEPPQSVTLPNFCKKTSSLNERKPYHYPDKSRFNSARHQSESDYMTYRRYRYYQRLTECEQDSRERFAIPQHVVPWYFYPTASDYVKNANSNSPPVEKKQSSVVTIFAIWNLLMGTSLLTLPWALHQAGLVNGVVLVVLLTGLCFYTASIILSIPQIAGIKVQEFNDACHQLIGRWAYVVCIISSFCTLFGACVVYYVLMSNFLYHVGSFIYGVGALNLTVSTNLSEVICGKEEEPLMTTFDTNVTEFTNITELSIIPDLPEKQVGLIAFKYWQVDGTVPFLLALVLGPFITLKSPNIFLKFNIIGSFSVIYLVCYSAFKWYKWNFINVDFVDVSNPVYVPLFRWQFPTLSGILSLALFLHNLIISLMNNQKHPENNKRDLGIAYCLVCLTYLAIACFIYLGFPIAKDCLHDNFLNNFASNDILAFVTRVFLLIQITALYPLLVYMLRLQVMHFFIPDIRPKYRHILLLNVFMIGSCLAFAVYFPRIGTVIRYCGGFAGFVFIYALPGLAYYKAKRLAGQTVSPTRNLVHFVIFLFGLANFLAQFFVNT